MKGAMTDIVSIAAVMVIFFGYIINIVQLLQDNFETWIVFLKVVGIFVPPFGVIMGLINL